MSNLLLIDDDEKLGTLLAEYFSRFDLQLRHATHPHAGLTMLQTEKIELLILDIMLPELDGFEVLRELRKTSAIPVIMLTARGDVMDRIVGLELGADDYLPKPFEPRELVARIQNILKRTQAVVGKNNLNWNKLKINTDRQTVTLEGEELHLTSREYLLLRLLAGDPGKVFSRDEILNHLLGIDADVYSRAVDILISRLRSKLKPLDCIRTRWGYGYMFIEPEK